MNILVHSGLFALTLGQRAHISTKTKLAIVRAANQSLRTECDIMLRHPGEKMYSEVFYILFERIISNGLQNIHSYLHVVMAVIA